MRTAMCRGERNCKIRKRDKCAVIDARIRHRKYEIKNSDAREPQNKKRKMPFRHFTASNNTLIHAHAHGSCVRRFEDVDGHEFDALRSHTLIESERSTTMTTRISIVARVTHLQYSTHWVV